MRMIDLWLDQELIPNVPSLNDLNGNFVEFLLSLTGVARQIQSDIIPPKYFQYVDDDGDPIDVKSEEEFLAFLDYWHLRRQTDVVNNVQIVIPLNSELDERHSPCSSDLTLSDAESSDIEEEMLGNSGSSAVVPNDLSFLDSTDSIATDDIRLLEVVGSGVSGVVYKAIRISTDQLMAVKSISLDIDPDIQTKILSELNILHKCCCPYIIGFFGAFFVDSQISICTEYMDGGSLDCCGEISEEIVGCVSVAVVEGLTYLWKQKIMHRDFKPSNILVNSKGEVKLCDFGVSVQLVNSIAKSYVGTNAYMAPERILGSEYGVHSEVWSLGMSLLEMALGHFPYEKIISEEPQSLPDVHFSVEFQDFISICLRKNPSDRPTPEQLLDHPFIKNFVQLDRRKIVSNWLFERSTNVTINNSV